jgi:hypothetical protein
MIVTSSLEESQNPKDQRRQICHKECSSDNQSIHINSKKVLPLAPGRWKQAGVAIITH